MSDTTQAVTQLLISELPAVAGFVRGLWRDAHPDIPEPTDAEVLAAFESAYAASRAKDDVLLAESPPKD